MIAIVSNAAPERVAFAALCASHGWACTECDSLHALKKLIRHLHPRIVLTRQRLIDGYSDDILAALASNSSRAATKVVVLIDAGSPSAVEARQIALGADLVQRDPIRTDVLVEYLGKYHRASAPPSLPTAGVGSPPLLKFAGLYLHPSERKFQQGESLIGLAPREITLIELLLHHADRVVTYEKLYSEILGRRFRGDTSNMRVLLGKLTASAAKAGVSLREWIDVIPKTGYRYRSIPSPSLRSAKAVSVTSSIA